MDKGGKLVIESSLGSIFVGTWDRDEVCVIVIKRAQRKNQVAGFEAQIEQRGNVEGNVIVDTSGGSIKLGEITGKSCINDSSCI